MRIAYELTMIFWAWLGRGRAGGTSEKLQVQKKKGICVLTIWSPVVSGLLFHLPPPQNPIPQSQETLGAAITRRREGLLQSAIVPCYTADQPAKKLCSELTKLTILSVPLESKNLQSWSSTQPSQNQTRPNLQSNFYHVVKCASIYKNALWLVKEFEAH